MRENDLGYVTHMGEMTNVHNILVGKSDCKRPIGRPRCRREDNSEIT
jgi:hypothetical protein